MKNYFEYRGYIGTVEMSTEDNLFFGTIHGINDLITFEGDGFKELQKAFEEAVDDYLIFCEECNKEPEKAYKGQFNVRVSPELHRRLAFEAAKEKKSLNQIVEKACSEYVNNNVCSCKMVGYMERYLEQTNVALRTKAGEKTGWQSSNSNPKLKMVGGGIQ